MAEEEEAASLPVTSYVKAADGAKKPGGGGRTRERQKQIPQLNCGIDDGVLDTGRGAGERARSTDIVIINATNLGQEDSGLAVHSA